MEINRQRGSLSIFGVGMALVFATFGALIIDLYQVIDDRQQLQSIADAMASAGASAVDVEVYRSNGALELLPELADSRAQAAFNNSDLADLDIETVSTGYDGTSYEVVIGGRSRPLLFELSGQDSLTIQVTAAAEPVQGS